MTIPKSHWCAQQGVFNSWIKCRFFFSRVDFLGLFLHTKKCDNEGIVLVYITMPGDATGAKCRELVLASKTPAFSSTMVFLSITLFYILLWVFFFFIHILIHWDYNPFKPDFEPRSRALTTEYFSPPYDIPCNGDQLTMIQLHYLRPLRI